MPIGIEQPEVELCCRMILRGGLLVPLPRNRVILGHPIPEVIQ